MDVMKRIGAKVEPTFAGLFDAGISQEVLQHFWGNVRGQMAMIGQLPQNPEDILADLATVNPTGARPATLLRQLGAVLLARSIGWRGVAAAMTRHCSRRSWQRYKRELKGLELPGRNGFQSLVQVDQALTKFSPLRMRNFETAPTQGSIPIKEQRRRARLPEISRGTRAPAVISERTKEMGI